jgi:adenylate cyclase, class 2
VKVWIKNRRCSAFNKEHNMQEIEAKFYVQNLKKVEARIRELDARLIQPRVLETNIRFDLPDSRLRSKGQVLRLRQDPEAKLTYKDSGKSEQGIVNRTEIEFTVSDFEKAKLFLEALGYQEFFTYEKYRTTYNLDSVSLLADFQQQAIGVHNCHIMLDEMPYGNFVEIEGENHEAIHVVAKSLNLDLRASISMSYSVLFDKLRRVRGFSFTDLTFKNFEGLHITPEDLQVHPADE